MELGATRKTRSRPCSSLAAIQSPASSGIRSGVISPAPPALGEVGGEALDAVARDEVPVGHARAAARRRRGRPRVAREHVVDPGAAGERLVGGVLDDRAVHERVAVGHADLDDVDAGLDHGHASPRSSPRRSGSRPAGSRSGRPGPRSRQRRRTSSTARAHRASVALGSGSSAVRSALVDAGRTTSAAVSMSLSPRPERLTSSSASGPSSRPDLHGAGERVRRLDGRDDALGAAEQAERLHRLRRRWRSGTRPGRCRAGRRARARRSGSRGRPRSSATRWSGRRRPAGGS